MECRNGHISWDEDNKTAGPNLDLIYLESTAETIAGARQHVGTLMEKIGLSRRMLVENL